MSDTATHQGVRRVTRVRTLGDAVPAFRPFRDDSDDVKVVPKTSDELRADAEARRDAQPMSTSCGVTGCGWVHTGTAGECRAAAAGHRASVHPELTGSRTHRKAGIKFKRPGQEVDSAVIAESRRLRLEREEAQRVETINRGRRARGETIIEGGTVNTCKREGCERDASDAPKAGPTSRLCAAHRRERSNELSASRTGKPRGNPKPAAPAAPAPLPAPEPVAEPSLVVLATELEEARADVERANGRYTAAVAAFNQHDVIRRFHEEGAAA
jgi:hypothetical protein